MCGFLGVISADPAHRNPSIVNAMLDHIIHRGPDDNGMFTRPPVTMGFRRLAIIDPAGGHQPMHSADGRYVLVFNGEVYNFRELRNELVSGYSCRFHTDCDAEVVLQAYVQWGSSCFLRFNGMFAIAIWDRNEQTLTVARDRNGKKPLFLYQAGQTLLFGSEIKGFLKHPAFSAEVDQSRLATSLAYRYVPHHETLFKNVYALRAGHWQVYHGTTLESPGPQPFWTYPEANITSGSESSAAAIEKVEALLTESVRRRMIADVPVGAFLSGGLDSSAIVALMSKISSEPIRTFSIGFDTGFSEHAYARSVAGHFKTRHHEMIVSADDLLKEISRVLWYRETPVSEPSDIPLFMLAREARRTVSVVLSGEGSDELFGGYPKYQAEYYAGRFAGLFQSAKRLPGLRNSASRAGIALESMAETTQYDRWARWFGAFSRGDREQLLSPEMANHVSGVHAFAEIITEQVGAHTNLSQMQIQDHAHWLPANLLLRGDRVTMASSLELRCPFLDPTLLDYALGSLPDQFKIRHGQSKWIIRQVGRNLLPRNIIKRRKWGFKVPVGEWFRGPLKQTLTDVVLSQAALQRGYFEQSELRRIIDEHLVHGVDHSKQLWYLYQLELWHLMFIDKSLTPGSDLRTVK